MRDAVRQKFFSALVIGIFLSSLLLSACQPAGQVSGASGSFTPGSVVAKSCGYGGRFKSIEAVDRYTVRFTLCENDPAFLSKLAIPSFVIQDEGFLNANHGRSAAMSATPNGTGPYFVKKYVAGQQIQLEANPDYWGVPAKNRTMVVRWESDPEKRLQSLIRGDVDGIDNLAAKDFEQVQNSTSLRLYYRTALNVLYAGFNNTIAPFDKEVVRQAFAKAINRQIIVDSYFPAGSMVAEQFVSPLIKPGYTDGLQWYAYDPFGARDMLRQAGYDFSKEIVLTYRDSPRSYLPRPTDVVNRIRTDLALIGIKVKANPLPSDQFFADIAAGKVGFYLLGWIPDYPDASNYYDLTFSANLERLGQPYADMNWQISQASVTSDVNARQKFYDQVNTLLKQHVPISPIAHGVDGLAFSSSIQNVTIGPLNENYVEMSSSNDRLVFLQSAEPLSLWPGDQTDVESFRIATLLYDGLVRFKFGGTDVEPDLAESWTVSSDNKVWTFYLRRGVKFTDGAQLDANDVVATFRAQWVKSDPNHTGNNGTFEYFEGFFGSFLYEKQ